MHRVERRARRSAEECPGESCPTLASPSRQYFGKVGMRHFHKQKNPSFVPTVNVCQLWHLLGEEALAQAAAQKAAGKAAVIDVSEHGFFKVLGKGELPAFPIVVRARFVSSIAERKIKAAGGAVVLSA